MTGHYPHLIAGILVAVAAVSSCGGNPVAPSIPTANILSEGNLTYVVGAFWDGTGKNFGPGCGTAVTWFTRAFDSEGDQFEADEGSLSSSRVVRPNESFLYDVYLPGAGFGEYYEWTFTTTFSWTDVAC